MCSHQEKKVSESDKSEVRTFYITEREARKYVYSKRGVKPLKNIKLRLEEELIIHGTHVGPYLLVPMYVSIYGGVFFYQYLVYTRY